jgi:hypothetical protein
MTPQIEWRWVGVVIAIAVIHAWQGRARDDSHVP